MKRQQGFTLIELMIVVAIVAILAAVALPFYADYTFRAKMSEVAASIDACKVSVQEYHQAEGTFPNSSARAGCNTTGTQYVLNGSPAVSGGSATGVTITSTGAGDVANCTLRLIGTNSGGTWTGSSTGTECGTGGKGRVPPLFRTHY